MARVILMLLSLLLTSTAAYARQTLGIYENWGAFRDDGPACFALAQPVAEYGQKPPAGASASIGYWPKREPGGQFHATLSRTSRTGMATLSLGDRRFTLRGKGRDMWATDRSSDRAVIAAIRGARAMSIAATAPDGQPFADAYDLRGAATAIDAAALGCLTERK